MPATFKAKQLDALNLKLLMEAVDCAPTPSNPQLLTSIVKMLIVRISQRSRKDAKYLEVMICNIAILESRFAFLEQALESKTPSAITALKLTQDTISLLVKWVEALAVGQVQRGKHLSLTVVVQRDLMATFLKLFNYPQRYAATRRLWFDDHAHDLVVVLSFLPCLCSPLDWKPSNRPSATAVDAVADRLKNTCRQWPKMTEAPVTYETLAILHNTTPENIRKLLH
jgi:hypothetical protein